MMNQNVKNWILFGLLSLIWGSSFILMKESARDLTGYQMGAIRIFAAGLAFFPFALFHFRHIPLRKIPLVILSGVLGNLFPAFLFAIAIERKVPSSMAGILNSFTPLFVVLIGIVFFRSRVGKQKIIGVLVGLVGLILLNLSRGPAAGGDFQFILLILLATLFYGLNVNLVSHYLKSLDPIKMATVSMSFIAIPATLIMWQQHVFSMARYDLSARWPILMIVLLGVTGTAIATALFYMLIQRAGGLFASLVTYAIPVVAIFWGVLSGEQVSALQIGCLGLILSGVYVANRE